MSAGGSGGATRFRRVSFRFQDSKYRRKDHTSTVESVIEDEATESLVRVEEVVEWEQDNNHLGRHKPKRALVLLVFRPPHTHTRT